MRKCLLLIGLLYSSYAIQNWRNYQYWLKLVKQTYCITARIHQRKGANYKQRLAQSTQKYITLCQNLQNRIDQSIPAFARLILAEKNAAKKKKMTKHIAELQKYKTLLDKHIDLVERRILKGETIPHEEKIFSIFEPHVEWKQKGKHHKKVELGHNVLVCSDQYHFIVAYQVIEQQSDSDLVLPLAKRLQDTFGTDYELFSISFDKGFFSGLNKTFLQKIFSQVILPKKGKKTAAEQTQASTSSYRKLRHQHAAVESNINELEQSGLNKVPDKGIENFKKYVGVGVLAYNLKRLGRLLIAQQQKEQKRAIAKAA